MANEKLYEDMEPREKFEALWLKAGLHKRPGADALLYDLEQQGFFDLPASIKHHSNRFGGLVTHTVNVADTFKITIPRCAPCGGYDKQCKHYRPKNK